MNRNTVHDSRSGLRCVCIRIDINASGIDKYAESSGDFCLGSCETVARAASRRSPDDVQQRG